MELIGIQTEIRHTERFVDEDKIDHDATDDLRFLISPKISLSDDPDFLATPYYQVFAERNGFQSNLSVIDLLFNMGPESILTLSPQR
jgi:hypothetical protein